MTIYVGTLAGVFAGAAAISYYIGARLPPQIVLLSILWYLAANERYKWFYIIIKTLPRDIIGLGGFIKLNWKIHRWVRKKKTVPKVFVDLARKQPNKVAFLFEEEVWTFAQVDEVSNRIANYFKTQGYQRGDCVSLFMESRPEYVCTWLGLGKIGVVTALINSNQRLSPLTHSVTAANSKAVIFGSELAEAIKEVIGGAMPDIPLFQYNATSAAEPLLKGATDLKAVLKTASSSCPTADLEMGKPMEKFLFIFTSGTTGLPKAAVINHLRFMFMAGGVNCMLHLKQEVVYNALPLYHTAGGMVGVGQVVLCGSTMALRKKFSASNFWSDCIKYKATAAQYIGEICRYLLAVKEKPEDKQHSVRVIFGNGLRPQIWEKFVNRFQIEQVGEFYGATEGNANLLNVDSKVGSVGFFPRYAGFLYPVGLIRVDEDTLEVLRGKDGLCIACQPGETGVLVGKIIASKPQSAFSGYADKSASKKKITENVFKHGDQVFNTGDILVMDELGYFYFKDRTGDTFRWRGENVATSEVEAVISNVLKLKDAAVYGVEIPNTEGRAGMAAVVDPENTLNLEALAEGIKQSLPSYARPLFIRVLHELPMTGTYKLQKRDLQLAGFDIKVVKDPLYFCDPSGKFVPLTEQLYADIMSNKVRL